MVEVAEESRQVRRQRERLASKGKTIALPKGFGRSAVAPKPKPKPVDPDQERLTCCALIRDGVTFGDGGFREHWQIRAALGDIAPHEKNPDDIYGFMTSKGRFVDRMEARWVGKAAGQCADTTRELLSSDIDTW